MSESLLEKCRQIASDSQRECKSGSENVLHGEGPVQQDFLGECDFVEGGVEVIADRVAAWLDKLVERRLVTEDEAVGVGLELWFRHGGEAVEYRHPSVELDDRFLPRRWRGEREAFAGLAAGKFPSAVTCVRDDEQGRSFWWPTAWAGELLERELAKDKQSRGIHEDRD